MRKLFLAITLLLGLNAVYAQGNLKFAIVDYQKIVDSLPSKIQADAEMKAFIEEGSKTIEELQTILEREYTEYAEGADTLSKFQKERIEKDLREQQEIIQLKQQSLQQDLEVYNDRFYTPIEENFKKAVKIVSTKHKLNYVMEKSTLLYSNGGMDITAEVKTELLRLETARLAEE